MNAAVRRFCSAEDFGGSSDGWPITGLICTGGYNGLTGMGDGTGGRGAGVGDLRSSRRFSFGSREQGRISCKPTLWMEPRCGWNAGRRCLVFIYTFFIGQYKHYSPFSAQCHVQKYWKAHPRTMQLMDLHFCFNCKGKFLQEACMLLRLFGGQWQLKNGSMVASAHPVLHFLIDIMFCSLASLTGNCHNLCFAYSLPLH